MQLPLLNFSNADTRDKILNQFHEVSQKLLCEYALAAFDHIFRITAVELYLWIPGRFEDPFTHKNLRQRECGTFYAHGNGRRAPNYSGIDLTCGNNALGHYGGILIRQLEHQGGSGTAMKAIIRGTSGFTKTSRQDSKLKSLRTWSDSEKTRLKLVDGCDAFEGPVRLVPKAQPDKLSLCFRKRFGLKLNKDPNSKFRELPLHAFLKK
jgi:hypothetical protein